MIGHSVSADAKGCVCPVAATHRRDASHLSFWLCTAHGACNSRNLIELEITMYWVAKKISAVITVALFSSGASAGLVFDFSFDATDADFPFQTAGPITGRILGLEDNRTTQAATGVVITGVGDHTPSFATPFDVIAEGWFIGANTFDVVSGAITSWSFFANDVDDPTLAAVDEILDLGDFGNPVFKPQFITGLVGADFNVTFPSWTQAAADDVTFSRVPVPATLALISFGLLTLRLRRGT